MRRLASSRSWQRWTRPRAGARGLGVTVALLAALAAMGSSAVLLAQPSGPADDAQEKQAAAHFAEGEHAFTLGDYTKAAAAFEAAYTEKPHEAALWNAARSWERAGELARAANDYRRYLRTAPDDAPDKKHAATALEALTPKLGRIEIVAPGLDNLEIDGRPVIDTVVFVNPGTHLVVGKVISTEATLVRRQTTLAAGATESVLLEPPAPPPASASAIPAPSASQSPAPHPSAAPSASSKSETSPPPTHHGTTPWLLAPFIGTTSISGVLLIASGIDVLRAHSDYEELKKGRSADEQQQLIQEGVGKTDRTNVLIGVTAGLAIATGIVAFTAIDWSSHEKATPRTQPHPSARLNVGPQGASLEARF